MTGDGLLAMSTCHAVNILARNLPPIQRFRWPLQGPPLGRAALPERARPRYYDYLIRDEAEFIYAIYAVGYILDNPRRAGLRDWPWVYVRSITHNSASLANSAGPRPRSTSPRPYRTRPTLLLTRDSGVGRERRAPHASIPGYSLGVPPALALPVHSNLHPIKLLPGHEVPKPTVQDSKLWVIARVYGKGR